MAAKAAAATALQTALKDYASQLSELGALARHYCSSGLLAKHLEACQARSNVQTAYDRALALAAQFNVVDEAEDDVDVCEGLDALTVRVPLPLNTRASDVALESDGEVLVASDETTGNTLARVPLAPRAAVRAADARASVRKVKARGDQSDGGPKARALHVSIPLLVGGTAQRTDAIAGAVAMSLARRGFAVVDSFLPRECACRVRAWAESVRSDGRLSAGEVEGGLRPSDRGDEMTWVDVAAEARSDPSAADAAAALDAVLLRVVQGCVVDGEDDARCAVDNPAPDEVGAVDADAFCDTVRTCERSSSAVATDLARKSLFRDKAMLTWYPPDSVYVRHIDNANRGNRSRVLTCVLYISPDGWDVASDGGCIRLFPRSRAGAPADIAPTFNRLVVFYADSRTPHEVRACTRDGRMALSFWYHDESQARDS